MHTQIHKYMYTIHACIHTFIHAYKHAYMHTWAYFGEFTGLNRPNEFFTVKKT